MNVEAKKMQMQEDIGDSNEFKRFESLMSNVSCILVYIGMYWQGQVEIQSINTK